MSEKPRELPAYETNASADLNEKRRRAVDQYLQSVDIVLPSPGQTIEKVDEYRQVAKELIANQMKWLEEILGISARHRTLYAKKIKFYTGEEWDTTTGLGKDDNRNGFNNLNSSEIAIRVDENELTTFSILNHEFVHAFSRRLFQIKKIPNSKKERLIAAILGREPKDMIGVHLRLHGFANSNNPEVLSYLNEMVTETISIEMLAYYRGQENGKDYLSRVGVGYLAGVIFFDMLLGRLGAKSGIDASKIKKQIYRGYFEGNLTVLKIIDEVFGKGSLKVLAGLDVRRAKDKATLEPALRHFGFDIDEFNRKVDHVLKERNLELALIGKEPTASPDTHQKLS